MSRKFSPGGWLKRILLRIVLVWLCSGAAVCAVQHLPSVLGRDGRTGRLAPGSQGILAMLPILTGSAWMLSPRGWGWRSLRQRSKFPEHAGVLTWRLSKALDHNEHVMKTASAAHRLLSQQTVKNLFLWDGRNWVRKGLEAGLTLGVETVWSKKRILTVYLNIAEFGDGVFGHRSGIAALFWQARQQADYVEAAHHLPPCCRTRCVLRPAPRQAMCEAARRGLCARCVSWVGKRFMERNNLR